MKSTIHKVILVLIFIVLSSLSCVSAPLQGVLFTHTSQHIYGKSSGSQIGDARIEKRGESCSWTGLIVLHPVYYGRGGSISEAMKDGNIEKIAVVDRRSMTILPYIFQQECVVVYGE